MGRRRTAANRGLPPNLYQRRGYYAWRDPRDGKEYGLGLDKKSAISQAIEANLLVTGHYNHHRLIDRVTGAADRTCIDWHQRYMHILEARDVKPRSIVSAKDQLRAAMKKWGNKPLEHITVLDVADLLKTWTDAGKIRMASSVRSRLVDFFREAIAAGWTISNPADATKIHGLKTKRGRLGLDGFKAILASAEKDTKRKWAGTAIKLAILTGQRRDDISNFKPTDVYDGYLHIIQEKTQTRLRLSLSLKLKEFPWTLGDVIDECMKSGVKNPETLIHARQFAYRISAGSKLRPELLTRVFADHRDTAGLGDGPNPPTFHEIRSLSGRLYEEAYGERFAQQILGHRRASTTAIYLDTRGSEWTTVSPPNQSAK
ncbi:phage integrase Arm DNA-binding domain-containing protein [Aquitalea magnusonii]|uniref:Phage integrase family protein n=1 Tax=Aquitalea magnusonii TaxID=332411 RepID=A0A318JVM2_9NEIS|nr:phage integrase Arm DNA-binding domain-containing protein [Aquitalea magnusonii]PXX49030.1 phage integrase family protein [Aquitalea magnusonii]